MGIHDKSKTIGKKRAKKNKVLAEVENSESSPCVDTVVKKTRVKTKKIHKKITNNHPETPKTIDLDAIESQLNNLKDSQETSNKKARKKIRQLEFLKKRYEQIKNTEESLKLAGGEKMETTSHSDDEKNEFNKNENVTDTPDNKDKVETMKGIKRFVVFVGNLPKSVTEDDMKTHFLKVGKIKSVRIPEVKENRKSGFAFVELDDNISFEKTLSMHHTMLGNKRINVLYTNPDGKNLDKKEIMKKNAKFDAMRKAGILTGSIAQNKKRSFRRKKKRLAEEKAANKN